MLQHQYETIIACINLGAAAQASVLIAALNSVVEQANEYKSLKKAEAEAAKSTATNADAPKKMEAPKATEAK